MFHMANDSHHFKTETELKQEGLSLNGNIFHSSAKNYLPLYEAKMLHQYNHRYGDFALVPKGKSAHVLPKADIDLLSNPNYTNKPRYWIIENEVMARLSDLTDRYLIGFRSTTDARASARTMIACPIPISAVSGKFPLIFSQNN